jgi:hypothetical protein
MPVKLENIHILLKMRPQPDILVLRLPLYLPLQHPVALNNNLECLVLHNDLPENEVCELFDRIRKGSNLFVTL